ncbi:MAG: elongation factor G [Planctomycetota bacterium]
MASVPLERMRNLGIVAHIDAGKTTVSERILFYTGVEARMGEVHEGTATLDYLAEERARGITITAAATSVPWRGHELHLIDTPGHVDFTVEVERCMRVLDGAVLVINAVAGVQAQTETVWRQMRRHGVRALAFVNQIDRPGADYLGCVAGLGKRLGVVALPLQYPFLASPERRVLVDLVTRTALEFSAADLGRSPRTCAVPEQIHDEVGVLAAELVERLAEEDEELLAVVLEGRSPPPELLRQALRRRVLAGTLMPVLVGSALRNFGVQPLLDAVVELLPSPLDVPPVRATHADSGATVELHPQPAAPPCALAFKLVADASEDLLFVRVYAGTLEPGMKLFNPRTRRMERVARILRMHADQKTALERALPGEIVALTGAKSTVTGDTLCTHDLPLLLERPIFPEPVLTRVVEPTSLAERDKLRAALERLVFEDPTFRMREDEETGQWLIAGMGELHLEIKEHRLRDDFNVAVRVGQPRVAYREALLTRARGSACIDRVLGGTHLFAGLTLELTPPGDEAGAPGRVTVAWQEGAQVPAAVRPAVVEALTLGAQVGPRFGFPLAGLAVAVVAAEVRTELVSEAAFAQAAGQALRAALAEAQVALLEPLMEFEIGAPADAMSAVIGDLNARSAEVRDLTVEGDWRVVVGSVPLFRVFGYASVVRSLSQGRASFGLSPAGFRRVPEGELAARGLVWS